MSSVVDLLRQLEERGWSGAAIAAEIGVDQRTIYRWLNGTRHPGNPRPVELALQQLLARKRVPKRRRVV